MELGPLLLVGVEPPDLAALLTDQLEPSTRNRDDIDLLGAAMRADTQGVPLFSCQHLRPYLGTDSLQIGNRQREARP